jgi:hypothetical protein
MHQPRDAPRPHHKGGANDKGLGKPDERKHSDRPTLGAVARGRKRRSPLDGLTAVPCQCLVCRWYRICDKAIALNGAVRLEGNRSIMVVADTVVAEVAANGGTIPDTYRFVRNDGRVVYIFIDEAVA